MIIKILSWEIIELLILYKSHVIYMPYLYRPCIPTKTVFGFPLFNRYFEILYGINIFKSFWKKASNLCC